MIFLRVDLNSFFYVNQKQIQIKSQKKYENAKRMNICLRNPFVRKYIFFLTIIFFLLIYLKF